MKIKGSIVALVTPFKNGKVDKLSLKKLIKFHLENNTSGILVYGTTGEGSTLTEKEKEEITHICVEIVEKRIPIIAGVSTNDTKVAIEKIKLARKAKADAALVIVPYYNKPTQKGILAHFSTIAKEVDFPIIIYNIPSRTGVNIEPETVAELNKFKNIIGIKEASGSLDQVSKIVILCRKDFVVLSGDDSLTLPILSLGGVGVISVVANILPKDVSEMCNSFLNNNFDNARRLHYKLFKIMKSLFIETNPIPVKTALSLMKMINLEFRLPLVPMSEENLVKLKNVLKSYNLI
jgi:4-hydroxy-tetrahydrodipicolinate synthase